MYVICLGQWSAARPTYTTGMVEQKAGDLAQAMIARRACVDDHHAGSQERGHEQVAARSAHPDASDAPAEHQQTAEQQEDVAVAEGAERSVERA